MTDDYYRYDEQHYAMIGERTGNVFRIGDEITVRVVKVNKDERSIDFEIVGMKGTPRRERSETTKVFKTKNKSGGSNKASNNNAGGKRQPEKQNQKSEQGKKPKKKRKFYENVPVSK